MYCLVHLSEDSSLWLQSFQTKTCLLNKQSQKPIGLGFHLCSERNGEIPKFFLLASTSVFYLVIQALRGRTPVLISVNSHKVISMTSMQINLHSNKLHLYLLLLCLVLSILHALLHLILRQLLTLTFTDEITEHQEVT